MIRPEERELNIKQHRLNKLEAELVQRELDLATLKGELDAFEAKYISIVGVCYTELDQINAKIAEIKAQLKPIDTSIREKAKQARAQAKESTQAAENKSRDVKFVPSDELKKLFREVAKNIHPDLTIDEYERNRRQQLMVDANRAYEMGNEALLQKILYEWETSPESFAGEGTAAELVRIIRKIFQVENRLKDIETEVLRLKASDLNKLNEQVEASEGNGRDILNEMASKVNEEIASAKLTLSRLIELLERP